MDIVKVTPVLSTRFENPMNTYKNHSNNAHEFKKNDAGEAFFKAGEVAEFKLKDLERAKCSYEQSADCYHQILSSSAYESYRKHVDLTLKQCGYIIETEFGDDVKCNEFYDWADEIRQENKIQHACQFTRKAMKKYVHRVSRCLKYKFRSLEAKEEIYHIISAENKTLNWANICRKCVSFWSIHSKHIHQNIRLLRYPGNYDQTRKELHLFETNLKIFINEVEKAYARSEKLADQSKKKALEDKTSSKSNF
ncbi:hypothetical protein RF11_12045 [Thelohanellus kitauei]|uniref:Uncharacterized protein n=1 Tax=Thelohanellus kitauei TaxID=669202 RepID=A0A0C2MX75_THEKT|nr:hypothetical protein RF11_12045 [Thelohanellus kitauei]